MSAPESNAPESPEGSRPFVFGDLVTCADRDDLPMSRLISIRGHGRGGCANVLGPDATVNTWLTDSLRLAAPAPLMIDSGEASWAAYVGATAMLKTAREQAAIIQQHREAAVREAQELRAQLATFATPIAGYLVRQGYEKNKGSYVRHEDGFQWRFSRRDASVFSREVAEHAAGMMTGDVRIVPTRRKP